MRDRIYNSVHFVKLDTLKMQVRKHLDFTTLSIEVETHNGTDLQLSLFCDVPPYDRELASRIAENVNVIVTDHIRLEQEADDDAA